MVISKFFKQKKKLLKKVLVILALVVSILPNALTSYAFEIDEANLYSKGDCGHLLKFHDTIIRTTYIVYNANGKEYPAYCLNHTLVGAEEGSYNVSTTTKLNNNSVWRTIINGFPYKSVSELGVANEKEAFAATKQAVYLALYGRSIADYSAYSSDAGNRTYEAFKKIVTSAQNSNLNEMISINLNIEPIDATWKLENEKNVSKTYRLNSNVPEGEYSISTKGNLPVGTAITNINGEKVNKFKVGEKFKIVMPIQSLKDSASFTITANSSLKTYPILYGKSYDPNKQNYAITGSSFEPFSTSLTDSYMSNKTKLIITKKVYGTNEVLQGVKFSLMDSNKKVLKDNLITNGKGQIVLENMLPGNYYIKETQTLAGYNLYTELINVGIDLNEEVNVIVNNTKTSALEINKSAETIEVVSSKVKKLITENEENSNVIDRNRQEELEISKEYNYDVKDKTSNKFKVDIDNNVSNKLSSDIENEINNDVKNDISSKIDNEIDNNTKNDISNEIDNKIDNNIKNELASEIKDKVINEINNQLIDVVKNKIQNEIKLHDIEITEKNIEKTNIDKTVRKLPKTGC